jgi:hypothetical protein
MKILKILLFFLFSFISLGVEAQKGVKLSKIDQAIQKEKGKYDAARKTMKGYVKSVQPLLKSYNSAVLGVSQAEVWSKAIPWGQQVMNDCYGNYKENKDKDQLIGCIRSSNCKVIPYSDVTILNLPIGGVLSKAIPWFDQVLSDCLDNYGDDSDDAINCFNASYCKIQNIVKRFQIQKGFRQFGTQRN